MIYHLWSSTACTAVLPAMKLYTNISYAVKGARVDPAKKGGLHCKCLAQHRLGSLSIVMIVIILCKLLM